MSVDNCQHSFFGVKKVWKSPLNEFFVCAMISTQFRKCTIKNFEEDFKMNEKMQRKYADWREKALKGNGDISVIVKGREHWMYLYKGASVPIDAMKVWVDKGEGLKEYYCFQDMNSASNLTFSMVIKNSKKFIFKDAEANLHAYGLDNAKTDLKRFCAFIKSSNLITFIFASAATNRVNIIENVTDPEAEVFTECIFDNPPDKVTDGQGSKEDLNESNPV